MTNVVFKFYLKVCYKYGGKYDSANSMNCSVRAFSIVLEAYRSLEVLKFTISRVMVLATHCRRLSSVKVPSHWTCWSYEVISTFQDGGRGVANPLPGKRLVMAFVEEGPNLFADQISIKYLNPWLRHYYTFGLGNRRHIGYLIKC